MLQVRNTKVYALKESIIACRNAMRTELPEYTEEEFEKSLEREVKLANIPDMLPVGVQRVATIKIEWEE